VPSSADQAINVGPHDQLLHVLSDGAEKSGRLPFAASSSIGNLSSVIGSSTSSRLKCANSTITMSPVASSDAALRGGACPTPEYTIAYTGNYTTSAGVSRIGALVSERQAHENKCHNRCLQSCQHDWLCHA
jgi:hypothetical protein